MMYWNIGFELFPPNLVTFFTVFDDSKILKYFDYV